LSMKPILLITLLALSTRLCAEDEKKVETNVAVQVAKIVKTTLHAYASGYGTIETSPTGGARLAAASAGLVQKVLVTEGAKVAKGDLLVQLDARAVDASVAKARASLWAAEKAHARQLAMKSAGGTSERSLLEAAATLALAQADLASAELAQTQLSIRAPLAGVIGRLAVRTGEWLDLGKDVTEIVNPADLIVTTQIASADAGLLHPGVEAFIFTKLGESEKPFAQGKVISISPLIAKDSDSVAVRVSLGAEAGRPGQLVLVRIVTSSKESCLAVPVESVIKAEDQETISVVLGGVAKQKPVKTGLSDRGLIEISGEGIAEGDDVVTTGAYGLPKETKVNILAR
ncbi:MAG: efflux RND transporter periplasmic adaptor subunit, partial [Verrucomicrobiota bacterium]